MQGEQLSASGQKSHHKRIGSRAYSNGEQNQYRFTFPAKFEADLVIADEGLPAYGKVCAGEDAIDRMLAPVVSRLQLMGVL